MTHSVFIDIPWFTLISSQLYFIYKLQVFDNTINRISVEYSVNKNNCDVHNYVNDTYLQSQ